MSRSIQSTSPRLLLFAALSVAVGAGCPSTQPLPEDAGAGTDAAVPATCTSDRDCSPRGLVCERATQECVECLTARDCAAGEACVAHGCDAVTPCTTTRQCPGRVCSTSLGHCVDCNGDVDCGDEAVCRDSVCVPRPRPCVSSRECSAAGLVCDPLVMGCAECAADEDCTESGDRCDRTDPVLGGRCRSRACTPGATECVGVDAARTCAADGSGWTEADCATGESCVAGACQPWLCEPGSARCVDPSTRSVCEPDGRTEVEARCPTMTTCAEGACTPWACAPGTTTCAGPLTRLTCSLDGLTASPEPCGTDRGCNPSTGGCEPQVCSPGDRSCGDVVTRRTCDETGLSFTSTVCGAGESCLDGACVARVCTPGAGSCDSPARARICAADGLGFTTRDCPASTSCSGGACAGWICTPGTTECADGGTLRTCAADGLSWVTSACGARATCSASLCRAWICDPGTLSCEDATTRRACNADGISYTSTACAAGEICSAGRCQPTPTYREAVLASAPIAYWPFDETEAGNTTDVIGGRVAVPTAGARVGAGNGAGLVAGGRSAVFDGTGYFEAPFDARLNGPIWTVELWARADGGGSIASPVTSRDALGGCGATRGWAMFALGTPRRWQTYTGSAGVPSCWRETIGPDVAAGAVVHLVATYDGTTTRLYVNGALAARLDGAYSPNAVAPLRIGAGAGNANEPTFYFTGAVDELALYDRALTPDEISTHHWIGSTPNLARTGTATQSSVYCGGCCRPAPIAIDGVQIAPGGPCAQLSIAGPDASAWWEVDLGGVHDVQRVVIWAWLFNANRALDVQYRRASSDAWSTVSLRGAAVLDFPGVMSVPIGAPARYVRLQRPNDGTCPGGALDNCTISLGEVEVIGR